MANADYCCTYVPKVTRYYVSVVPTRHSSDQMLFVDDVVAVVSARDTEELRDDSALVQAGRQVQSA